MKISLTFVLLLLGFTLAWADDPVLYTKSRVWQPAVYNGSCCITQGYWYTQYAPYTPKPVPKAAVPALNEPYDQFSLRLLDLKATQDRAFLKERALALNHRLNLELLEATGLKGSFYQGHIAPGIHYGDIGVQGGYPIGSTGNSLSGYSAQQVYQQDGYGQLDRNAMLSLAGQLAAQKEANSDREHARFAGHVQDVNKSAADILAIRERRQFAVEFLKHVDNPRTLITTTVNGYKIEPPGQPPFVFPTVPTPLIQPPTPMPTVTPATRTLASVFAQDCAKCHGAGARYNAAFNLEMYLSASPERRARFKSTLRTTDPVKRMPRNDDASLSPGAISAENLAVWDLN